MHEAELDATIRPIGLRAGAALILDGTRRRTKFSFLVLEVVFVVVGVMDLLSTLLVGLATTVLLSSATSDPGSPGTQSIADLAIRIPAWAWLGIAMIVIAGKNLTSLLVQRRVERFMRRREAAVAEKTFAGLLNTPSPILQSVDIVRLLNGVTWWAEGITGGVLGQMGALSDAIIAVVMLTGLLWLNPWTCLASAAILVPTFIFTGRVVSRRSRQTASDLRASYASVVAGISDGVTLQQESRLYRLSAWLQTRVAERYETVVINGTRAAVITRVPLLLLEPALLLGLAVAATVSFATRTPSAAAGELVVFALALSKIIAGLARAQSQLSMSHRMFGEAAVAAPLIASLKSSDAATNEDAPMTLNAPDHLPAAPRLVMETVEYSYPGQVDYHFGPITLDVPGGSRVAVVGSTGAGKTTFVDLATGLLSPTVGSVRWLAPDGQVVDPCYGYVPQTSTLIRGTILENVLLDHITDPDGKNRARRALTEAHGLGIVDASSAGLGRAVGDRGEGLSGGERQRISLSRALARHPNVLILDEATSALDAKTESLVSEAVRSLSGRITVLVIAHRLTTVADADLVILLGGGRLLDFGTFEDLVQRNPEFQEQARLQGISVGQRPHNEEECG